MVGGILVSSCPVSWCLLVTPKSDTSDGKPTLLTATATLYLSILFCFFAIAACSLSALHCHKIRFLSNWWQHLVTMMMILRLLFMAKGDGSGEPAV